MKGVTPESVGMKSDHFVGDWYVKFEKKFVEEYKAWQSSEEAKELFDNRKDKELAEADFLKLIKTTILIQQASWVRMLVTFSLSGKRTLKRIHWTCGGK